MSEIYSNKNQQFSKFFQKTKENQSPLFNLKTFSFKKSFHKTKNNDKIQN